MTTRHNRLCTLINRHTNANAGPWGIQIGHPCGFIATDRHLAARPSLSKSVGDFLLNDASMAGDFEDMLMMMKVHGCKLSKRVKLHLKHWVKAGCPTHKNNSALSIALHGLYTGKFKNIVSTHYEVRDLNHKFWSASN
jgi:hypothetical protein